MILECFIVKYSEVKMFQNSPAYSLKWKPKILYTREALP